MACTSSPPIKTDVPCVPSMSWLSPRERVAIWTASTAFFFPSSPISRRDFRDGGRPGGGVHSPTAGVAAGALGGDSLARRRAHVDGTGFFSAGRSSWLRSTGSLGNRFEHSIQTNGTRLDDAWCELFKEHHFLVGLSVDGPHEMHDAYRVDKGRQWNVRPGTTGLEDAGEPCRSESTSYARFMRPTCSIRSAFTGSFAMF